MSTAIQWTDETWNPVTGCAKVSPGCAHCYAETVAARFWPTQYPQIPIEKPSDLDATCTFTRDRQFTDVQCHEDRLDQPLRWKKPRRIFVNSMSDLFHEAVPDVFIERVFSVMALSERHTFQVLTKRPARMLAWFRARRHDVKNYVILQTEKAGECLYAHPWPLPNVWLGVSVENQHFADERIPLLLQTPAVVRFISAEPLLGPVDLSCGYWLECEPGLSLPTLDWIIVGGESGKGARPCDVQWVRSIVRQGQRSRLPVFVKQLGANVQDEDQDEQPGMVVLRDRKGGDPNDWPIDLRVREFPATGGGLGPHGGAKE